MRALLDVNVLIALLDASHMMHVPAMRWLERHVDHGWATCPITQNGCVRIMSQPAYPIPRSAAIVAQRLAEACASDTHQFWPADIHLVQHGLLDWTRVLGHRQITDAYLLALAARHGGRFVTFDQRLDVASVTGASPEHLVVLSA